MDPVSMVVTAMSAGSVAAPGPDVSGAVDDLYRRLKAKIFRKADQSEKVIELAENYERDPEMWQAVLRRHLEHEGARRDPELLRLAAELLELVDERGSRKGRYEVTIRGIHGVQIGNSNIQINVFE